MELNKVFSLLKVQGQISRDLQGSKVKYLSDKLGNCTEYELKVEVLEYKGMTVRVIANRDYPDEFHVVTLGENKRKGLSVSERRAVKSVVQQMPSEFFKSLGCERKYGYIERGYMFDYSGATVKFYSLIYENGEYVREDEVIAEIEEYVPVVKQTNKAIAKLKAIAAEVLDGVQLYIDDQGR